jgi:hypothetical protein
MKIGCDQQSSQSGSDVLLGPVQRAVTDQEEQRSHDRACDPVLPLGSIAARVRPGQQDSACDSVTNAGGHQRRDGLDRVPNRKVRRTPDEVDGREGERELDGVRALTAGRICGGNQHGPAPYVYQLS